jgi:hypothetical protein
LDLHGTRLTGAGALRLDLNAQPGNGVHGHADPVQNQGHGLAPTPVGEVDLDRADDVRSQIRTQPRLHRADGARIDPIDTCQFHHLSLHQADKAVGLQHRQVAIGLNLDLRTIRLDLREEIHPFAERRVEARRAKQHQQADADSKPGAGDEVAQATHVGVS